MLWRHVLQNIAALTAMVVLIVFDYQWWSLVCLLFVLYPSGECECDKDSCYSPVLDIAKSIAYNPR